MKTRKELFEFLSSYLKYGGAILSEEKTISYGILADKLIQEGFVQVQEPREFWIVGFSEFTPDSKPHCYEVFKTKDEAYNTKYSARYHLVKEIIHVREVIE